MRELKLDGCLDDDQIETETSTNIYTDSIGGRNAQTKGGRRQGGMVESKDG